MDPDYIGELLTRIQAENDYQKAEEHRRKRRANTRSAGRNTEVVDAEVE
jgi:hypothetical protein